MFAQATASSIATDRGEQHHHGFNRPDHRVLQPRRGVWNDRGSCPDMCAASQQQSSRSRSWLPPSWHRRAASRWRTARSIRAGSETKGRRKRERGPHIGATRGEPIGLRRKHTDDRVAHGADLQRATDGGRIGGRNPSFQNAYPSMTAGVAPKSLYSSGCSARPICGGDAEHGDPPPR